MTTLKTLAIVAMVLASAACSDQARISRAVARGDTERVVMFVRQKVDDPDSWSVLQYIFRDAAAKQTRATLDTFEDIILRPTVDTALRRKLLQLYDHQVTFSRDSELFDAVLSGRISDPASVTAALKLLSYSPPMARRSLLKAHFRRLKEYNFLPILDEDVREITLADAILPEGRSAFTELNQIEKNVAASYGTTQQQIDQMLSLQSQFADAQRAATDLQLESKAFELRAFVVAQQEVGKYEIASADDLTQHALLITTRTQFRTKGFFRMLVKSASTAIPVRLKEDLGGFSQSWPLYVECDSDCLKRSAQNQIEAARLQTQADDNRQQRTRMSQKLKRSDAEFRAEMADFNQKACALFERCDEVERSDETLIQEYTASFNVPVLGSGTCWETSEASQRFDAWRCMAAGSGIYDPCFEIPGRASVACFKDDEAVRLDLTKDLPKERWVWRSDEPRARKLLLRDGTQCRFVGGATGSVNGRRLDYSCEDGSWLISLDNAKPLWIATRVRSDDASKARGQADSVPVTTIPVRTVWQ